MGAPGVKKLSQSKALEVAGRSFPYLAAEWNALKISALKHRIGGLVLGVGLAAASMYAIRGGAAASQRSKRALAT